MWYIEPGDQSTRGTGVEDNEYGACICQSKILHVGGEQRRERRERSKDGGNEEIVMGRRVVNNTGP